jgi:hypothetical protein
MKLDLSLLAYPDPVLGSWVITLEIFESHLALPRVNTHTIYLRPAAEQKGLLTLTCFTSE